MVHDGGSLKVCRVDVRGRILRRLRLLVPATLIGIAAVGIQKAKIMFGKLKE